MTHAKSLLFFFPLRFNLTISAKAPSGLVPKPAACLAYLNIKWEVTSYV
jgi:hypothetical protein